MFTGFLLSRSPRNMPEGGPRSDRRTNSPVPAVFDVTVRMAAPTDRVALERLAGLDSARVPADLVDLLQVRARQLRDAGVDARESTAVIQLRRRTALADRSA